MKKISKLKTGFITRNFQMFKMASKAIKPLLKDTKTPQEFLSAFMGKDFERWPNELSMLKGSLLKAGQLLSMYGEYFLPEDIKKVLRKLQNQTHYIDFDQLNRQLDGQHKKLRIEKTPFAAASIGQVHECIIDDKKWAMKIQYPGIEKAIKWDLFFLKKLLTFSKFLPRNMNFDPFFDEVSSMLRKEMDYKRESKWQMKFFDFYQNHHEIFVPKVNLDLSTDKVLISEYIEGVSILNDEIFNLSQKERNRLGELLLTVFLDEIFHLGVVQSDAHGGNFLYSKGNLYLLDFGSCKEMTSAMKDFYRQMIVASFKEDYELFLKTWNHWEKRSDTELPFDREFLWTYFLYATIPLRSLNYDWGECCIPDELYEMSKKELKNINLKNPPFDFIFIDRKVAGLYFLLKAIKAQTQTLNLVKNYIS